MSLKLMIHWCRTYSCFHKSGTLIEIQPSGDVVIQQKNNFQNITGDNNIHTTGNMNYFVDGDVNFNTRVTSMLLHLRMLISNQNE